MALSTVNDANSLGREFIFKIISRHKHRSYGDEVQYGDVISLVDFLERPISCTSGIAWARESTSSSTPFRFLPFLPFENKSLLQAGHTIRLQHVEEEQTLAVSAASYQEDHAIDYHVGAISGLLPDSCRCCVFSLDL